jgi:hypothetical protein
MARLKRRVLIALALVGGVGLLALQNAAGDCESGPELCGTHSLRGASMGFGLGAPEPTEPHERVNPAMAAALAAREAADRTRSQRAVMVRDNPARAAALAAVRQGAQATSLVSAAGQAPAARVGDGRSPAALAAQRAMAAAAARAASARPAGGEAGSGHYFTDIIPGR